MRSTGCKPGLSLGGQCPGVQGALLSIMGSTSVPDFSMRIFTIYYFCMLVSILTELLSSTQPLLAPLPILIPHGFYQKQWLL